MGTDKNAFIDGILVVDKPREWTSHDVCAFLRSRFKLKKVGHAGTLDPIATGVLVILVGRATKLSAQLAASDKSYAGIMQLGVATDSHDLTGKVLQEAPWEHITAEDLRTKALDFTGQILQTPPMVSALKHKGVRLYKLARRGQEVPRESRKVTVEHFEISEKDGPLVSFTIRVSKGTYVRTIIHDLGASLGCHAALRELRRLESGRYNLAQSITVEALKKMEDSDFRRILLPLPLIASVHAPARPL